MAPPRTAGGDGGPDAATIREVGSGASSAVETIAMENRGERDGNDGQKLTPSASTREQQRSPVLSLGTEIASTPLTSTPIQNTSLPPPVVPPPAHVLFRRSGAVAPAPLAQKVNGEQHVNWRLSNKSGPTGDGSGKAAMQGSPQSGSIKQNTVSFALSDNEATPLLGGGIIVENPAGALPSITSSEARVPLCFHDDLHCLQRDVLQLVHCRTSPLCQPCSPESLAIGFNMNIVKLATRQSENHRILEWNTAHLWHEAFPYSLVLSRVSREGL